MTLKYKYQSKDEIPTEHLSLYAEHDGAWHLTVEGAVDKTKLEEFRANNVALLKEREEWQRRFEGIDPDEARAALAARELSQQKQEAQTALQDRLNAVLGERDTLHAKLSAIQIDQGVIALATRRRLRPTAIPDITARARSAFRLVDGVATALNAEGQTPLPGKDGASPLTLEEWVDTQVSEAPHLFEPHAGGGVAGSASGGGGRASVPFKNPFRKETWNLTEQWRLQKSDPRLAEQLRGATA